MSRKKPALPSIDDVLRDRVKATPGQLFALIHEVNPTARTMPERDRQARYATKARLISRLLARDLDEVDIERDPDPDVVLIRRRADPADVVHARVPELDDEARSRVRRRLDESSEEADEEPARAWAGERSRAGIASDPFAAAAAALAAYDYEAAEAALRGAFVEGDGDVQSARALLELYLDHLGRDEDAVAVEPELSADAYEDPSVRALLALAAARTGRDAEARAHLASAGPTARAGDVFAALAQRALARGDLASAERDLRDLHARSSAHVSLPALEMDLDRARAALRRPLEIEIAALEAQGALDEAEARATALLRDWPQSEVAGRFLRSREDHRRGLKLDELLRRADELTAARDYDHAAQVLRQARSLGVSTAAEELDRKLREVDTERRAAETEAAVVRVVASLSAPDLAAGLLAYTELAPPARELVRQRRALPVLDTLEDLDAARSSSHARAAVAAAIALAVADGAIARRDFATAESELAAHDKLLSAHPRARQMAASCRQHRAAERVAAARDLLDAAGLAHDRGQLEDADRQLAQLDVALLTPEGRARAETLREATRRGVAVVSHRRAYEAARVAGNLLAARDALVRVQALDPDGAPERAEVDRAIRAEWRLEVFEGEGLDLSDATVPILEGNGLPCVCPGGERLYWVTSYGRWIFVRVAQTSPLAVVQAIVLRAPEVMRWSRWNIDGDLLWITTSGGALLALRRDRWDIAAYHHASAFIGPGESAEQIDTIPGGRFAHLTVSYGERFELRHRLVDLERRRVHRELSGDVPRLVDLWLDRPPRFAVIDEASLTLFGAGGGPIASHRGLPPISTLAIHPSRPTLIAVGPAQDREPDDVVMSAFELDGDEAGPRLAIEHADHERLHALATSRDEQLAFLACVTLSGDARIKTTGIIAIDASGRELSARYRVEIPGSASLLTDREGRFVFVSSLTTAGLEVSRLGAEPPRVRGEPSLESKLPPIATLLHLCSRASGAFETAVDALQAQLDAQPHEGRARWLRRHAAAHEDDPRALAASYELARNALHGEAADVLALLLAAHPEHPDALYLRADEEARKGRWATVRALIDRPSVDPDTSPCAQHCLHLRAMAAFNAGDFHAALRDLERARALATGDFGDCDLEPWIDVARAHHPGAQFYPESPVTAHVRAIAEAEAALARGDARSAAAILDAPAVWSSQDRHAAGLRVAAHLALDPSGGPARFAAIRAVAAWLDMVDLPDHAQARTSRPVSQSGADDELVARARGWLDA